MRHYLSYVLLGFLAFFLIALSGVFAWVRSAQLMITTEPLVMEHRSTSPEFRTQGFEWREIGPTSYHGNCRNCHGDDGSGWDQYPGLADAGRLYMAEGGREYIIDLHLYGLTSDRWRAPMPAMNTMPDVELAAVINHILVEFSREDAPEDGDLLHPGDIKERRDRDLSPADVNTTRPTIE
ncbi:MAG: cytochrome c [Candidatus Sumerlaeia bacterium]|nr:cytochrome c [Candidatus Sumerlaeia bacterium]